MTKNTEAFEKWFEQWRASTWHPLPSDARQDLPEHWAMNAQHHMSIAWQAATTEANKRIAELEREVAELKAEFAIVSNHIVSRFGEEKKKVTELQSQVNMLRSALEEMVDTFKYMQTAFNDCVFDKANEAISATDKQSLIEHDNEALKQIEVSE